MTIQLRKRIQLFLLAFSFVLPMVTARDVLASEENAERGTYEEAALETGGDATRETGKGAALETEKEVAPETGDEETPEAGEKEDPSGLLVSEDGDAETESESEETVKDEYLEKLMSKISDSLPADNGSWSVCVVDLVKGSESCIHNDRMQAASLIKLYIMGAVYEDYDDLTARYGKDAIDSWLYSMITVSDNDAANALVGCLGDDDYSAGMMVVNDYCLDHGYYQTSMGRLLLQSNESGDNYTSVSDCAHFLLSVYKQDLEETPHVDDMYSLLKAQTRRHKIPAQMPEGVGVANKTGELDDVENDAAILYDTANDLVIVFMSENLSDVGRAQSTIASLSREIYDYYAGGSQ